MANENLDGGATKSLENGTSAVQEVSSTTPTTEITKRSLRVQCWRKIQENKISVAFNFIFNRIPRFVGGDKAAENLITTDEFKKSQHIKVSIDRALHYAKLQTLLANKTLYLPATRESDALFLKVDVPADATDEQKEELLNAQDVHTNRTEIGVDAKVTLDMVLIGSVVVSRDGYRIGRGNGFTDLDIGLLIEVGAVTPNTVIATMVHDVQVMDTLPTNLFQKYDTPVDLIVTPTEIIRVTNRLPRPTGIFWELLSERRLKIVPSLAKLRDQYLAQNKQITLKEYDTDIEQNIKNRARRRGPLRHRYGRRNPQRRTQSQTDTEQHGQENTAQQPRRYTRDRPRRFVNRRRRTTKSEGDHSGVEGGKNQDHNERKQGRNDGNNEGGKNMRRQKPRRARMPQRDFCIKLSNLSRDVRVKDLKTELRRRECQPLFISWKAHFGKCYLHFGNRDGTPSTEEDINKVLESLSNLSLTVNVGGNENNNANATVNGTEVAAAGTEQITPPQNENPRTKTVNVNVELIKYDKDGAGGAGNPTTNGATDAVTGAGDGVDGGRIEAVDTTTV